MKRNMNSLIGYKIAATDGEIGEVKDFYFDDKTWTIRYLIIETGSWLSGRKVLISPQALAKVEMPEKLTVNLTVDQIRNSPDIDTQLPVSRQQEEVLHRHHAWQNYWESDFFGGGVMSDIIPEETGAEGEVKKEAYDAHLQSAVHVNGYHIHALDGELGHVSDFILDDESWRLTDFVIDTHNWIGGKRVMIGVEHVQSVQWYNYEVFLDININTIENSPEYSETGIR